MWHWGPIVARTCCTHNIAQGHSDRGGTHQGWQGHQSRARLRERKRQKSGKSRSHFTFALAPLTLVTWRHRSCCTAEHVSGQLLAPESQTRQSSSRHSQEGKQLFLPSFFLLSSRRKTESNDSLIEDFLIVYLSRSRHRQTGRCLLFSLLFLLSSEGGYKVRPGSTRLLWRPQRVARMTMRTVMRMTGRGCGVRRMTPEDDCLGGEIVPNYW